MFSYRLFNTADAQLIILPSYLLYYLLLSYYFPVAYSLAVHPPIVIVNLLPQGGRFELMHAIRKTVVWYADLEPGQQAPIHSLGLDIPLLIMVNLGFCRTPVGEGAIVHHGGDAVVYSKGKSV
jgi:hypothetical protein